MSQRLTGQKAPEPVQQATESKQPSNPTGTAIAMPVMKQSSIRYPQFVVKGVGIQGGQRLSDVTVDDLPGLERVIKSRLGMAADEAIWLVLQGQILKTLPDPAELAKTTIIFVMRVPAKNAVSKDEVQI